MPTDQPISPQPTSRSLDALAPAFTGENFSLHDLYSANLNAGGGAAIEGRVFTDCVIHGPALMLVLEDTNFDSTNFGPTGGDFRNMLFRPLSGTMAIGSIPIRNCKFVNCHFFGVGITGNEQLLQTLLDEVAVL